MKCTECGMLHGDAQGYPCNQDAVRQYAEAARRAIPDLVAELREYRAKGLVEEVCADCGGHLLGVLREFNTYFASAPLGHGARGNLCVPCHRIRFPLLGGKAVKVRTWMSP